MMHYDDSLVLPSSCSVLCEEEMVYVEGGVQVYLTKRMFNKSYCLQIASKYTKSTGLSKSRIAKEIFSHAILYLYGNLGAVATAVGGVPLAKSTFAYIKQHSNPVDIGGDPWYRVAVYNAIWYGMPSLT